MTQPSTGPLCRDCKHMVEMYDMAWCNLHLKNGTRSFHIKTIYERCTDGGCGPDGKNYEARS